MSMKRLLLLFCLCVSLSLISCERRASFLGKGEDQVTKVSGVAFDPAVPNDLWPRLLGEAQTSEQVSWEVRFSPLNVYLIERSAGLLGGDRKIEFPRGGGVLDLADFLRLDRGSFYFGLELEGLGRPDQVFFIGTGRERQIDSQMHGHVCTEVLDISDYFRRVMRKDGILTNVTDQRHIALLAGTYFFMLRQNEEIHLAYLHIEDSRYPSLQCSPIRASDLKL